MKTFGLIGKNINYSFSRGYFSEKFKRENLDTQYLNFDMETLQNFPEVLIENPQLAGLNVTIPYKQEIISYLDSLDPVAKTIGAVNTIKFSEGKTIGYNTDYFGFLESIKPHLPTEKIYALILGTGGASLAVAYGLKILKIPYKYVSRNSKKAEFTYSHLDEEIIKKHRLIINCTPLGTSPDFDTYPNIPLEFIGKNHLVYDLIYNPPVSRLLQLAAEKGAKIINGQKMLELQAEKAWQIWNS